MAHNDLIRVLQSNKTMASSEEVRSFDQALTDLAAQPHKNDLLPELFSVFNDECKHIEVMWGLLHYIETFDLDLQTHTLADVTPILEHSAREWLKIFYVRTLNHDEARSGLKSILPSLADDKRNAIREILTEIAQKPRKNTDLARDLRMKVESVLS